MARWRTVVALAALALLLAAFLLVIPSIRVALPGMTQSTVYTNPVIRWDFADPHVIKARDGFYYAYSTDHLTSGRHAREAGVIRDHARLLGTGRHQGGRQVLYVLLRHPRWHRGHVPWGGHFRVARGSVRPRRGAAAVRRRLREHRP